MSVKETDNTQEVLSALDRAIQRGLEAIGLTAERYAKEVLTKEVYTGNKPWKLTGRLRNSIGHKKDDSAVYIGTDVEYALGIELGTHRKAGAVHFLQKAASEHADEYQKLMEESIKNA